MSKKKKRKGWKSPKWGHLGVYFRCTGPNPQGPRPGPRLKVVIYDNKNRIIRRLEQVQGEVLDPGYVDFFLSPQCRVPTITYHLKDFDPEDNETILFSSTSGEETEYWLKSNFGSWAEKYGKLSE